MSEQEVLTLQSEAGFRALFDHATISILVVSEDGVIVLANPNSESLFGYRSEELVGRPVEILVPKMHRHSHSSHRQVFFRHPKARPMGQGMELHAQKKDGSEFPVEISLGHYELEGFRFAVAFVNDITERKQMELELKSLNTELEQKIKARTQELADTLERERKIGEMKSAFVSKASHEFRTPLSTVLSSISLIQRYNDSGQLEKSRKHISRIKDSVQNLNNILNDFLSLDKLEQGRVQAEKEMFDLKKLSSEVAGALDDIRKEGQKIIHSHQGATDVFLDRKVVHNVLLNLLPNAIKYSEKNIDLITRVEAENIMIVVEDRGMGIPLEDQEHLFSKFFRAKNASHIQGTGLGLHIVKRYVELLDGTIDFSSTPGEGTRFELLFMQKTV